MFMNSNLELIRNLFNIENFNIYSDDDNYYFFRSLEEVDVESIKNTSIIDELGNIIKLITDREFYGETIFTKDSDISLEEMVEHIKKNYNKHTNCISFSSNANVCLDYGRSTYSDDYVVLKVPKSVFGVNDFFAGEYMLSEVSKVLDEFYSNLDDESDIKKYFDMIDNANSQEELELVKEKAKEQLSLEDITDSINYDALNDEQNLLKNKIILKANIMNKNIIKKIGNSFLFSTIGSAISSLEVIHYKDINKNLFHVNAGILDIFGLLQQVPETDAIKEIKKILLNKLNNNELNIGYLSSDYDKDALNSELTIESLYKLCHGHISYRDAREVYQKAYSLAKSRFRKDKSIDLLEYILNDSRYREVLDELRTSTYGVEADIINRRSAEDSVNVSESVNLKIKEKELYILDFINGLSNSELIRVLENPVEELYGLLDQDLDGDMSYEEWVLNSIIDLIDWDYYGIDGLSGNSRKALINKLTNTNYMDIYNELKNNGLSDIEVANMTLLKLIRPEVEINKDDKFTIDELDDYLELNRISGSSITLKPYQMDAFKNINKAYKNYDFTSVVLPTGTGKSYVAIAEMSYITEELRKLEEKRDAKILYIAPNNYILDQLKGIIVNNYRQSISESDDDIINRVFPNLTLCTYTYLVSGADSDKIINEKYDLIIFDELHRTGATEWSSKIDKLLESQTAKVLGITATPERDVDGMDMTEEFAKKYGYSDDDILLGKHISYYMDIIEAIEKGIINDLEVLNCEYALSKDGSLEELKYKIDDIVDLDERDKKTREYDNIRKSVLAADGIEKILKDNLKENGKYIVFIPLTPKKDGTYEDTETGSVIPESRAQGMIKSYKNLMNQFLFAGKYLEENKEILTDIYNKINGNLELLESDIEFLNKEKENILLLRRLNIKGCPNALQTLSNDLSESITEYMNWEKLNDSKIASIIQKKMKSEVESYCMLSEYGKNNNKKTLGEFNSSKSNKKKFMFVMDMLNEGVHVDDIDGIIWLRPLGKNSKILFKQQLGRCITAVEKDKSNRIPQIIDMVNNTLKVCLDSDDLDLKEDLLLIRNISNWIERNRRMPNDDANNIEERVNYNYLKVLKNKYSKYLSDEVLEIQPVRKKKLISEIIKIGSNFDLWNYDFISRNAHKDSSENDNERDLLSAFKVSGVLRRFTDLYNRVEELLPKLSFEEKLIEFLQAIKNNNNKIVPQKSPLVFSDGVKVGSYWYTNRDKIYNTVTVKGNIFFKLYKEQCEVIIKEYNDLLNNVQLSIEEKLPELLQAIKDNNNKIISSSSPLLFSDGTKMNTFWWSGNNKNRIYALIMKENNPYMENYREQCEVLIRSYNSIKNKVRLTDEEKLFEYLQAIKDNDNKLLSTTTTLTFSNGDKMCEFRHNNKERIYKRITADNNPFVQRFKEQCDVLVRDFFRKPLTDEERLFEYLQGMAENNNKIIPRSSSLLFSDGTKMGFFLMKSSGKDKVYNMITTDGNPYIEKYKEQCEVIIKDYNKKQLSDEEKLLEYLQAMKDNDNKIFAYGSPLKFSDGRQMSLYWQNNKDRLYKMITTEKNIFIEKFREQCEVLIRDYNKKQLSDEEKLLEYLQAIKENNNKMIYRSTNLLFSDGSQMRHFWHSKSNKKKIYNMITCDGNIFIERYREQCEVIIKDYNKKQLSDEERLLEYFQAMIQNDNKLIPRNSTLLFSDGLKMKNYWDYENDNIYKMITSDGNIFREMYKVQCDIMIKEHYKKQERKEKQKNKLNIEDRLLELLEAMKEHGSKALSHNGPLMFSDGTGMGNFWHYYRERVYKMITADGNPYIEKYREQCDILIEDFLKYKSTVENKITAEEKLFEYLQAMKEHGNRLIPQSSPLKFSDGRQMRGYWSDNKDKIYVMVTEENNPFIEKYREQCEVIINEYVKFQEIKKQRQEEFDSLDDDYRSDAVFDKVLDDEMGKVPNEDGKIL